jgi:ActR/RegA family two-component response regulator
MSIYLPPPSEPGPERTIQMEDTVISGNERVLPVDDETGIVEITGYGEAADEQSALKAGADAYVRKPTGAEALACCIRRPRAAPVKDTIATCHE